MFLRRGSPKRISGAAQSNPRTQIFGCALLGIQVFPSFLPSLSWRGFYSTAVDVYYRHTNRKLSKFERENEHGERSLIGSHDSQSSARRQTDEPGD